MPEMTDREWEIFMDLLEEKLDKLKEGLNTINQKLDEKPCVEHGEAIASLVSTEASRNGGNRLLKNKWVLVTLLGAGVLGGGTSKVAENLGAILKVFLENMGK